MDTQIDKIEAEIHEHLEIDHGDVTTYVNVFEVKTDLLHVIMGRHDNSDEIKYNKLEMFMTEEQFADLTNFFSSVNSKIYLKDSAGRIEALRREWANNYEKQETFIKDDREHINLQRPNLLRDIQDSNDADSIKFKMRDSKAYCVRFYGTLCNNELIKGDCETGYSWRATGGLIADILGEGDYMDWYCSGGEGNIDEEVEEDLLAIGWKVVPYDMDIEPSSQMELK